MNEMPGQPGRPDLNPGDVAPDDRPDVGEDVCPDCGGSGLQGDGECPTCGGSGRITEPVGGG